MSESKGRKPLPPADTTKPELVEGAGTKMLEMTNTVADIQKDEVLAAGIDLGRLEALDFVLTVSTSAMLAVYENVKKSKAWKYLRNPQSSHGEKFQSLNEFCEVKLGKSYKRLQAITTNRNAIGEQAFEQAEKLGLRQVDYNAIKALPAPEQELVRRAVEESNTRDEVLDVLQELAARHAKAKEAADKENAELRDTLDSKDQLIAAKSQTIQELQDKVDVIKVTNPHDRLNELFADASKVAGDIQARIKGDLRQAFEVLQAQEGDSTVHMAGLVGQLIVELGDLREEYSLPDVSNAADLQLAAEVSQWAGGADAPAE